jgi:hypothetical protein
MGIMLTPLGTWMQSVAASGGHRNCARDWRGAERPRKRRNPRKARFFAEQKMRPNEVLSESHIFVNSLQEEALYHVHDHAFKNLFNGMGGHIYFSPLLYSKSISSFV